MNTTGVDTQYATVVRKYDWSNVFERILSMIENCQLDRLAIFDHTPILNKWLISFDHRFWYIWEQLSSLSSPETDHADMSPLLTCLTTAVRTAIICDFIVFGHKSFLSFYLVHATLDVRSNTMTPHLSKSTKPLSP